MIWADWGENCIRTGFYEEHTWHDGYSHRVEAPVRVVAFAGGYPGPLLEPRDALNRMGGAEMDNSSIRYHKKCQYMLPIKALNELIEDNLNGPNDPVPLHSFSWEWLD